jgi:ferredoxin
MRVTIDEAVCLANGLCESLAGAVFEVSEQGVGQVRLAEVPEELRQAVIDAAALCPSQAITITAD